MILRSPMPRAEALLRNIQYPIPNRASLFTRASFTPSIRHASTSKATPKPIPKSAPHILSKPDKFNPPSHPSRLVKPSPIRQYGPALTEEQKETHKTKQYPHMPPPKGSLMDRFLNSRPIHTSIALGVLLFFALWTFALHFKSSSPYAGQMPGLYDWAQHPIQSFFQFFHVLKLHELHESEIMQSKREWAVAETMKTKAYRVMHGLEPLEGQPTEVQILVARMKGEYVDGKNAVEEPVVVVEEPATKRPVKKWFGIW